MEQNNREKANEMVWSPDKVRREHAHTKSVKSSIDAVQKTARETQAYMDWNDEEATTSNKFDMGKSKSRGKGSRKMKGYFETIVAGVMALWGLLQGFFSLVFSVVVQKSFSHYFCLFFYTFFLFFCSVSLDFSSVLFKCMVWAPGNSGGGFSLLHHSCYPTRCKSVKTLCCVPTLYRLCIILRINIIQQRQSKTLQLAICLVTDVNFQVNKCSYGYQTVY